MPLIVWNQSPPSRQTSHTLYIGTSQAHRPREARYDKINSDLGLDKVPDLRRDRVSVHQRKHALLEPVPNT